MSIKKSICIAACIASCVLMLGGCGAEQKSKYDTAGIQTVEQNGSQESTATVYAMDTTMTLKAIGSNSEKAVAESRAEIERLDGLFRRGSESSEIYAVNNDKTDNVSDETAQVIGRALDVCSSTDGAFDISIAPVMDLWGFYTKEFHVPSQDEINEVLKKVDYRNIKRDGNKIELSNGVQMDLGGIAKGYTSAKIADIFKQNDVVGIVSLGGNVQAAGTKPDGSLWRVAIQNPDNESYIGSVSIADKAVITSGGYQRFFEQDGVIYHHIVDPKTGYPAESGLKSVTIISDDGTLADGLSTSLYVMGLEKAEEYWRANPNFDAVLVDDNGKVYVTEGAADIFKSDAAFEVIKH